MKKESKGSLVQIRSALLNLLIITHSFCCTGPTLKFLKPAKSAAEQAEESVAASEPTKKSATNPKESKMKKKETAAVAAEPVATAEPAKKKRGRKSKAELEAAAAIANAKVVPSAPATPAVPVQTGYVNQFKSVCTNLNNSATPTKQAENAEADGSDDESEPKPKRPKLVLKK